MKTDAARRVVADDDKLLGIELLRFASALAVLIFHYQHLAFVGTTQVNFDITKQPFYSLLNFFYNYGFRGVQVFWCISGFIFFWKYGERISQAKLGGYSFFILRLSRLYPLHVATLLFMAAMQLVYFRQHNTYFVYASNDLQHFVLQLFMASNWGPMSSSWGPMVESFNGPIWSISIEVLVYGVFFLSLRYVSGSPLAIGLMAAISAAVVFLKISTHTAFSCAMFFYLGCMTAILYAKVRSAPTQRTLVTIAALLAIVGLATLKFFIDVKPMYFLVVFSPALIFLCTAHIKPSKFGAHLLTAAGSVTYSSYLLHVPLQISIVTYYGWAHRTLPFYSPSFFLVYLSVTLLLSYGCYKYFEVPAQNMLRKTLSSPRSETRAVAQLRP
jgi:peptidoglycan/LPS O-acetylase OafA/YrhL